MCSTRFSRVLYEGVQWRALPGDFPAWQTVYTYFRNWRRDGTWLKLHNSLREWIRIEPERHPSPSEAIIDIVQLFYLSTSFGNFVWRKTVIAPP